MFRFLPRDDDFFGLLRQLGQGVREATEILPRFFQEPGKREQYAEDIKSIEHRCDDILSDIVTKLSSSFITPLDREDIHSLSHELDTIADRVNGLARRSLMYKIDQAMPVAVKMSEVLIRATSEIEKALPLLEKNKNISQCCSEIKRLEKEGDNLYSTGISDLFSNQYDPLFVIKWQWLYDTLEDSIDHCKAVSELLESIMLKHS